MGLEPQARYVRVDQGVTGEKLVVFDRAPWLGGSPTGEILAEAPGQAIAPLEPSKIVCIGTNYRAHAIEMGKPIPSEPLLFLKPPSSVIGPNVPIARPRGYLRTDFEGELGVVIGKRARRVSATDAPAYIFGYTIVNDVTVRDLQQRDVQFTRAKGFDTFCPVGPAVVGADAKDGTFLDPSNLSIRTRVNGEVKQDSSTSDLIFDIPTLVSFISHVMTLEPGDLISTGTPSGVGPIEPGDRVEIEIESIGLLVNRVIDAEA
jgi:2-keto-4-pentenoate hydratase/2-oxohepta-3-ene-1,7-dioic acid hydratase in catechol pathway